MGWSDKLFQYIHTHKDVQYLLNTIVLVLGWSDKLFQYKLALYEWSTGTLMSSNSIVPSTLTLTSIFLEWIMWSPHDMSMDTDVGNDTVHWTSET